MDLKSLIENYVWADVAHHVTLGNDRFRVAYGSGNPKHHHFRVGGLMEHTLEVIESGVKLIDTLYPKVDKEVYILSALFHDYGKMWDYTDAGEKVEHARIIHHISRSAIEFNILCSHTNFGVNEKLQDKVTHCILSHHGRREWGSPVAPKTKEAWLLHLCDCISARMDDCDKFDPYEIKKI